AAPGALPFARGTRRAPAGLGWQIHQRVLAPDAGAANEVILEELEGGVSGVGLRSAGPGQTGIALNCASGATGAGAGVFLDYAPVQLLAGTGAPGAARHYLAALKLLKAKPGEARSFLNIDPIGCLARFGTAGSPSAAALADAVKLAAEARASGAN